MPTRPDQEPREPHVVALKCTPLNDAIGCEISGIDLRDDLSQQTFEAIRQAWYSGCILLIRDQALDETAQVKFASRFGELGKILHQH